MSKVRATGVLGGLTVVGLLVLSSLVLASDDRQSYFGQLKGAFTRGCVQQAEQGLQTSISEDAFLAACSFVIETLRELRPGDGEAEIREALVESFRTETPGLSKRSSCEQCIAAVQDLEVSFATNNTVQEIEAGLLLGCEIQFSKPARVEQCQQNVGAANVPAIVDFGLSELPPLIACQQLEFCPR